MTKINYISYNYIKLYKIFSKIICLIFYNNTTIKIRYNSNIKYKLKLKKKNDRFIFDNFETVLSKSLSFVVIKSFSRC